jgi:PAS domain S-box-containing protein
MTKASPTLNIEESVHDANGKSATILTSKVPLKNVDGEIIGILGIYTDITERKQTEDALRQSENKYKTLLENLPQRIFLKDRNSVYVSCNESYAGDLKIEASQIAGKTDYDFYTTELAEKYRVDDKRIVESGQTEAFEEKYIRQGEERIVHTVKTPVRDEQGNVTGILGIFWDITEYRQAQDRLDRYREKMSQAERLASLGTLSATLAHELTQPLTVVRLSIENALADLETTPCPVSVTEGLEDSLAEMSHTVSIIDRLRNFARKSSKDDMTQVDLKAVAGRITQLLDGHSRRVGITVRLENMDSLPAMFANEKDMEQLFFALVENAIHAADGKENRQLAISAAIEGQHIELRFSDNCGGIAPKNLDKIFEPFFTTKPAGEGTGLGLCIVQRIVSHAGGKIRVESKTGKGSTFFISLPVNRAEGS